MIREFTNEDCMELMARYPDNHFDLAIVDPPYGINVANMNMGAGNGKRTSNIKNRKWVKKGWDSCVPTINYFNELFRVSSNQVIWGGNYFSLPASQYFCIWDKGEGLYGRSFAEMEYGWVRNGGTRIFKQSPVQKSRIHPTQKPVALYKWLLTNYAKEGDLILDTHVGSASSLIACEDKGFSYVGCELDPDYFEAANTRIAKFRSQLKLQLS